MTNNLFHIFCLSSTRTDSNLNTPKLRVLRSGILMFNSKIIYYTSAYIKFLKYFLSVIAGIQYSISFRCTAQ